MTDHGPEARRAFINYRVKDTLAVADALFRELTRALGDDAVFLDHRGLEAGGAYPPGLEKELRTASVVLALVGPFWLTLQGEHGVRRLDEPEDWVRRELEIALEACVPIVPVLIDGTTAPTKAAFRTIPKLEAFAELQGVRLESHDWEAHFERLVEALEHRGFRRRARSTDSGSGSRRPFASTIPPRGRAPFEGRSELLGQLSRVLEKSDTTELIALYGPSGVGKSELAREYARTHLSQYPGGTFLIDFRAGGIPADLESLGATILNLPPQPGLGPEDRCLRVLLALGTERCLLIYDDVQRPEDVERWLPPSGMRGHVIATTTRADWDQRWHPVRVGLLGNAAARTIVEMIAGPELGNRFADRLIARAEGLPVQLIPAAAALMRAAERGRAGDAGATLATATSKSFAGPWAQLSADARLVLAATLDYRSDRIPRDAVRSALMAGADWPAARADRAFEQCEDLFALEGAERLRIHRLWALFVREHLSEVDANALRAVRTVNAAQLHSAIESFLGDPASSEKKDAFLAFAVDPDNGLGPDADARGGDLAEEIALALLETGRFDDARPWFERAVGERERDDAAGRIDNVKLGASLHHVGFCYSSEGKFDEARRWFERAVAAKEKGDADGRVDRNSVGASLHQVGYCDSITGKFVEARAWFERAVVEKQKGDVEGRVDHAGIGTSMHQVGYCYSADGKPELARPWFERAAIEKESGDLSGRLDHNSLGASVHQVGYCWSAVENHDEARRWFERAVTEKKLGDIYGRIDQESLGSSVHQVGYCYASIGQIDDARSWFEQAVAVKKNGDIHGRIDHDSVGISVHRVGLCHLEQGSVDEARCAFLSAIGEKERGDVHGRVDHQSLGASLHYVGVTYLPSGEIEEAKRWLEKAIAHKEKGDVHGRVDRKSLDASRQALADPASAAYQRRAG